MRTTYLAGVGLGLVAAVVFASATTGPLFARFLLMFILPLPIALAGFGWGWRSAAFASAVGSILILLAAGLAVAAEFALFTQAIPTTLLTYLALLSRPVTEDDEPVGLEWYPAGRLVVWSAVLAGLGSSFGVLLGRDIDALAAELANAFVWMVAQMSMPGDIVSPSTKLDTPEIAALTQMFRVAVVPSVAVYLIGAQLFSLWLAGRVTLASGQLGRPWPDLAAVTYPQYTPLAFGILLLATMLDGYAGFAASAFAGSLFVAYLLLGLAILHFTTRGQPWRPFALWALYGMLFVVNIWIGIVIALLGLAETVLHLRARSLPPGPPPSQPHA